MAALILFDNMMLYNVNTSVILPSTLDSFSLTNALTECRRNSTSPTRMFAASAPWGIFFRNCSLNCNRARLSSFPRNYGEYINRWENLTLLDLSFFFLSWDSAAPDPCLDLVPSAGPELWRDLSSASPAVFDLDLGWLSRSSSLLAYMSPDVACSMGMKTSWFLFRSGREPPPRFLSRFVPDQQNYIWIHLKCNRTKKYTRVKLGMLKICIV